MTINNTPTIMDKSSWDTPRKKNCFVERVNFSISNFHISTSSPLFNVVITWQCPRSVFQHWKGGEGGLVIDKKICFFQLRKDTDRKRLFCSNVSTLLSMIVVYASEGFPSKHEHKFTVSEEFDQNFNSTELLAGPYSPSFLTRYTHDLKRLVVRQFKDAGDIWS